MTYSLLQLLKTTQQAQEQLNQANFAFMEGRHDKAGMNITQALRHLGDLETLLGQLLPKTD